MGADVTAAKTFWRSKNHYRTIVLFILLTVVFNFAVVLNVNTGSVDISTSEVWGIILNPDAHSGTAKDIIWKIRLPRLMLAAILGGALATSGYLLQTFFRNPIASPFVLGISSGAKMFVGFIMLIVMQHYHAMPMWATVLAAFLGSMLSTGFVLIFAKHVQNMSMLLVVGIMIGYICSAVTDFFVTFAKETDIANLTYWSMGSFSGANFDMVKLSALLILPTFFITVCYSKPISAYLLSENYAQSMGVNVKAFRVVLILLSSVLSATVTAFAGPVSFVGIAVPLIVKKIFKTAQPIIIIPATFYCGAIFCLFCDLIARTTFSPVELSISTVTAIFGAPIVVWQIVAKNKKV